MRISRVRQKLAENKPVICTKMNTLDPMVADIIGLLGFDCLWICNEHTGINWDRMDHLCRVGAVHGMDTMVRVDKGSYCDFIRPLELGATGLMVPHCKSAAEAAEIGQATRFQPLGRRALDSGNVDGAYCLIPMHDYLRLANENTFVVVQIEDPEALDQIDEIASAPGVDVLFVGPADLTHALGVPGQFNDPRLTKAIEDVAAACKKYGKHWGLPVSTESAPKYLEMGARFVNCGADVIGLGSYFKDVRAKLEKVGFEFSPKL
ncbi:MAG: aldolase/citrate lyase family protein [Bryobacteraceae bacterium]